MPPRVTGAQRFAESVRRAVIIRRVFRFKLRFQATQIVQRLAQVDAQHALVHFHHRFVGRGIEAREVELALGPPRSAVRARSRRRTYEPSENLLPCGLRCVNAAMMNAVFGPAIRSRAGTTVQQTKLLTDAIVAERVQGGDRFEFFWRGDVLKQVDAREARGYDPPGGFPPNGAGGVLVIRWWASRYWRTT